MHDKLFLFSKNIFCIWLDKYVPNGQINPKTDQETESGKFE
jgi:hypothetical protein